MADGSEAPARRTRRDRFKDVAARRTRRLLRDIRLLANCANRAAYEYTEDDVAKMFGAIEHEVAAARARFDPKPKRKEVQFSLD